MLPLKRCIIVGYCYVHKYHMDMPCLYVQGYETKSKSETGSISRSSSVFCLVSSNFFFSISFLFKEERRQTERKRLNMGLTLITMATVETSKHLGQRYK